MIQEKLGLYQILYNLTLKTHNTFKNTNCNWTKFRTRQPFPTPFSVLKSGIIL